jgi:four helix bundle protein
VEKPHKKLDVWQGSMDVARMIYSLTNNFPSAEKFGLVSQMRRAAVSIPSNIAEGAARQGKKEFRNFLSMAQGSLSELDTQLEISVALGYIHKEHIQDLEEKVIRVDKMLTGLIRNLSNNMQRVKSAVHK